MTKLISIDDFKAIRPISSNVDSLNRLDPYIIEAQRFDLRMVLGSELFHDLLTNYAAVPYIDLLAGGVYTDNDKNYEFEGLKVVIAYYTYARFVLNDNERSTASGFVIKKNEFSEPISEKSITRKATNARNAAEAYFSDVVRYMETFPLNFPLWKGNCSGISGAKSDFRVIDVGNDSGLLYDKKSKTWYRG